MIYKKLFSPVTVTALLIFASAFVLFQLWGTPLRDAMNEITVLAIYGVLILSYLLRFALVFFGLYALYRILWERANGQEYRQRMEVQIGLK